MNTFTTIEVALLMITLGYGFVGGFMNTVKRIAAFVLRGNYSQNQLGKLLDALFYAAIGYLCYVYFGWSI